MSLGEVNNIKHFKFVRQKKWWVIILGGLINSSLFAIINTLSCFSNLGIARLALFCIIIPFILIVWCLSSTSLSKFFISTFIFPATFIAIGLPLSETLYFHQFNVLHPGVEPGAGDGLGMVIVLIYYIPMSVFAWILSLVLTAVHKSNTGSNGVKV